MELMSTRLELKDVYRYSDLYGLAKLCDWFSSRIS